MATSSGTLPDIRPRSHPWVAGSARQRDANTWRRQEGLNPQRLTAPGRAALRSHPAFPSHRIAHDRVLQHGRFACDPA